MKNKFNLSTLGQAQQNFGFAQINHEGLLTKEINALMIAWKLFHHQPLEHKLKYKFGATGGYEYKSRSAGSREDKENFHVTLDYIPENNIRMSSIDEDFFRKAKNLIASSQVIIINQIAPLYSEASGLDVQEMFLNAKNKFALRALHYPMQDTEILAESHIDKGVTVHLIEDSPGFEVLRNGLWQPVQPMHNHMLTYAGATGQYYSNSAFDALCHRVVNTEKTKEFGRNSIVEFIDFGEVFYDKETWGTTQDVFPAGENYGMPFDKFQKFFKKRK